MVKSPEVFTVFYAWQSDTPQDHCRHLIREALDEMADRLNADPTVLYRVNIDQDTQGETGLCDIPAALLGKIDRAGAVVADLTFVAVTAADPPKHCSNPNVLFELGYAFRSVGPERIVCVLNEQHGPRAAQIFDLNHRRHPISFKSPNDKKSRADTVAELASALVAAISPIVALGPRSLTSDDASKHESDAARMIALATSRGQVRGSSASLTFKFRPARYHDRRWNTTADIEQLIRRSALICDSPRLSDSGGRLTHAAITGAYSASN